MRERLTGNEACWKWTAADTGDAYTCSKGRGSARICGSRMTRTTGSDAAEVEIKEEATTMTITATREAVTTMAAHDATGDIELGKVKIEP